MLTIIIFTNGRYNYLVPLLNDIVQSNVNANIKVVNYGKNYKKKAVSRYLSAADQS